jgi:hypothetical protein
MASSKRSVHGPFHGGHWFLAKRQGAKERRVSLSADAAGVIQTYRLVERLER